MEMPTSPVLFCIHPDGKVFADLEGNWREYKAVPVPPHGRLIDADALRKSFRESVEECHKWADEMRKAENEEMVIRAEQALGTFVECSLRAKNAPTIVPSEEEASDENKA